MILNLDDIIPMNYRNVMSPNESTSEN